MRLLNVGLRGATLLSKFALVFFLARFLTPAEVGLYGLVAATVGYGLYVVGLDFYTYSTRMIIKLPREEWGRLLVSQAAFFGVMYALVLPLSMLLFILGVLPWEMLVWFMLLLLLEHVSQELSRLLVAAAEQLTASLVLFFRSGAWCAVAIAWMWWMPERRNLDTLFLCWVSGNVLGTLVGVLRCGRLDIGGWRSQIDWAWIGTGIKIALPLLLGTLALRGIYTLDRYWFESLVSLEVLGAYVLFMGMCNALMAFLDAGVFMYAYPALIRKHHAQDKKGFENEMIRLLWLVMGVCMVFVLVSAVVLQWLVAWLDRPIYSEYIGLFWWLLAATVLFALGMVPHYGLYARGQDRPIVGSHLAGLGAFIAAVWLGAQYDAYLAVPLALVFVFVLILATKSYFYLKRPE